MVGVLSLEHTVTGVGNTKGIYFDITVQVTTFGMQ